LRSFLPKSQIISLFEKLENLRSQLNIGGDKEGWFRESFLQSLSVELPQSRVDRIDSTFPKVFENLEILEVVELVKYYISEVGRSNAIRSSYVVLQVNSHVVCKISVILDKFSVEVLNPLDLQLLSIESFDSNRYRVIVNALVILSGLLIYYEDVSVEVDTVITVECL
jgi:hypothetical protein